MKQIITISLFILIIFSSISSALDRGHVYISGRVDDIGDRTEVVSDESGRETYVSFKALTVSGVAYKIEPNCRVAIQYKERDIFHEKPVNISDIRRGDSVYIKKIGDIVYEVLIEGWKR